MTDSVTTGYNGNAVQFSPKCVGEWQYHFASVDNVAVVAVRRKKGTHQTELVPLAEIKPAIEALPDGKDRATLLSLQCPQDEQLHRFFVERIGLQASLPPQTPRRGVLGEIFDLEGYSSL